MLPPLGPPWRRRPLSAFWASCITQLRRRQRCCAGPKRQDATPWPAGPRASETLAWRSLLANPRVDSSSTSCDAARLACRAAEAPAGASAAGAACHTPAPPPLPLSAGLDPFYGLPGGLDPYALNSLLAGYAAPGYGAPPPPAFFDPFWVPGVGGATRRRLTVPIEGEGGASAGAAAGAGAGAEAGKTAGAGAGGEAGVGTGAGAGQEVMAPGGRRTREPFTVGSAGWTRSIPCDFIEVGGNPMRLGWQAVKAGSAACMRGQPVGSTWACTACWLLLGRPALRLLACHSPADLRCSTAMRLPMCSARRNTSFGPTCRAPRRWACATGLHDCCCCCCSCRCLAGGGRCCSSSSGSRGMHTSTCLPTVWLTEGSFFCIPTHPLFALQSEIHVEVHDGNVLRFGHVPGSGDDWGHAGPAGIGQGWLASACGRRMAVDLSRCRPAAAVCMAAAWVQPASGCLAETRRDLRGCAQSARRRMRRRRAFTIERSE